MTTLHIITGLNDGGAEAVLYRLCSHDRVQRHHVVSLTGPGKYGPMLGALGVDVTCLNLPRGKVRARALWRLWREIRRIRPDVVQTWMYHADLVGGVAARLAGCRNVVWGIHNSNLSPGETARSTILVARVCARLSRLVPRCIICCAERAREVHAALGYEARRMVVVPNGYDLSQFRPDPDARARLRGALGIAQDAPLIGFVARFDPQKDHRTLLRALALLGERGVAPQCLLVGTGMEEGNAALAAMIAETGTADPVHLLGRRTDIPAVMNALDLHVMSSVGEAFPNVLAEAMACGTPCVSTDVGDAGVILGDTGRIVPPRDPAALAEAIAAGLQERALPAWQARQAAARARIAENFTIDRMVGRYRAVWNADGQTCEERD
ncbi:MAG: glycosyltransferase [Rubellimicrobium sp.]|nr:glycosyltransferase [Rubellimicrobium sp.]